MDQNQRIFPRWLIICGILMIIGPTIKLVAGLIYIATR